MVVFYILLMVRQKRQEKRSAEMLETFKVGDKVVTHIGIYGKIKRIYNSSFGKVCVLEIGNTNKIDIEIDMRYIAGLDEKVVVPNDPPKSDSKDKKEISTNDKKEEIATEQPTEESTQEEKPSKQSKNKK